MVPFFEFRRHRRLAFSAHNERLPSSEYLRSNQRWCAESHAALLELARGHRLGDASTMSGQAEIESGELVELRLESYSHTDWLVGVDLLWNQSRSLGRAGR